MEKTQKDLEMKPIKDAPNSSNLSATDEDDVIIGRFRKISSAKSMGLTNDPYALPPTPEVYKKSEVDVEGGLQMKSVKEDTGGIASEEARSMQKASKSSFRNTEKPSRFRDQHSITRFQMAEEAERRRQLTDASEESEGFESDDPLTGAGTVQDTKYGKSFRHFTREALPRMEHYRHVLSLHAANRPTLDELHNASLSRKADGTNEMEGDTGAADELKGTVKFGWIKGVLMRCLLNIWGVMLFLRLTWVVAQAGVAQSALLILTTTCVTTITALSMAAISTNGLVKGGGTYYMISRSLGPEFGGSIGLIFSLANAVACAMYVVGFCEALISLIPDSGLMVSREWDQSIYGCITIVLLTGIVVIGMEWEAKAQIGLLVILLLAIADFVVGTFIGPKKDYEIARGFVGYNMGVLKDNMGPDYREYEGVEHGFFSVLAIFFPAATGILAGANISGDLKDPSKSIPKGTLLAIFLTTLSYLLMALLSGWTVLRDASGLLEDVANGTMASCRPDCHFGLHHDFHVIELVSAFSPLIVGGCFAATLSSALASLVSAPKVFQALCKDKLYPGIESFGKGYGRNKEPVRGYILTLVIAIGFILIGNLNTIAPLISNFFLAAYTLINFSTFHASLAKPVGWRPTFRYYNMWLSLGGAVVCVAVMFLISWATALVTFVVVLSLYLIVASRKPDVNWGSTPQAQTYKSALSAVQHLNTITDHVKNYRPQILVLTGYPGERPVLTDFAYSLTKGLSLLICGHIMQVGGQKGVSYRTREALSARAYQWLEARRVKGFYAQAESGAGPAVSTGTGTGAVLTAGAGAGLAAGAGALLQAAGLGKLRPNILLMGFKLDWRDRPLADIADYVEIMHKALDMHVALAILKVEGGLHNVEGLDEELQACLHEINSPNMSSTTNHRSGYESKASTETLSQVGHDHSRGSSMSDLSVGSGDRNNHVSADPGAHALSASAPRDKKSAGVAAVMSAVLGKMTPGGHVAGGPGGRGVRRSSSLGSELARRHQGTVDVWWLYDDGGLTLLLPYILSTRRAWASCRLRVFTIANKSTEMELEERNMASLLSKFRIEYSALKMIADINQRPRDSTLAYFERLIARFRVPENPQDPDSAVITEGELVAARDRTHRHLRLRELLREHSAAARLVCVTLPMPRRKQVVGPALYMAWLDAIAGVQAEGPREPPAPPVLLVRGNHSSVLTFYS